jgi:hypothetical protein
MGSRHIPHITGLIVRRGFTERTAVVRACPKTTARPVAFAELGCARP